MSAAHVLVLALVVVVFAAAWLAASLTILRANELTTVTRAIWLAAVFVFPVLGPIVWFASRRSAR
jgi:hypothetical protein